MSLTRLNLEFTFSGGYAKSPNYNNAARIWDSRSGQLIHKLEANQDNDNAETSIPPQFESDFLHLMSIAVKASFSPDGSHVVTISLDGTTRVWTSQSGQLLHELEGAFSGASDASFSPDGSRIATASQNGTARIWDSQSGQLLHELEGHLDIASSVSFSPDNSRVVTTSFDGTARIWDSQSGQLLHELEGHLSGVIDASFSPDSSIVATASNDNTARVWDTRSGQLIQELKGHQASINSASFSADSSRVVTASDDNTARVWDIYDLDGLLAIGCDYLTPYFVSHPEDLETLTICHTPARKQAAAPAYVRQGGRYLISPKQNRSSDKAVSNSSGLGS